MSSEEFTPDLSGLASDYQILSALRSTPDSRTYLARSLRLNRDVTITILRPDEDHEHTLNLVATDARQLAGLRHRNVVPVVEGRWLPDGMFAIVRARVRGVTLAQTVASTGPLPAAQVASTLEEVRAALDWARENGIAHRHVRPESIVMQQGSGRILVELEPFPLGDRDVPDVCDDARTIGKLAYTMLSGRVHPGDRAQSLLAARPDLSPEIAGEVDALIYCNPASGPHDATTLISLLSGERTTPATLAERASAAVLGAGTPAAAVVRVKRPFGFNARLAAAIAVLAILGIIGAMWYQRRERERQTVTRTSSRSTSNAGEVGLKGTRGDSTPVTQTPGVAVPAPDTSPMTIPRTDTPVTRRPVAPPETRRSEPPRGVSPLTMPSPATRRPQDTSVTPPVAAPPVTPPVVAPTMPPATPITPIDTTTRPAIPGNLCDSATPADQQRCLMTAVENADRDVSILYERVVAALRRQANVAPNDPDPPSVDSVRRSHRRWLEARDDACRGVGMGALYARARAACYVDQAARRASELNATLAGIPPQHRDTLRR